MAYIDYIKYSDADGRLKEIYDDVINKRGKLASVHMVQALNPESIVYHMDLYLELVYGRSPLKRYQREMIAVVVSKTNDCDYCKRHHSEAVNHFWKDEERTARLGQDYEAADLSDVDVALCELSVDLTKDPGKDKKKHTDRLKALGLDDRAVLDAVLIIGYFNFVNRLVLGLGVHLEEDGGKGYEY